MPSDAAFREALDAFGVACWDSESYEVRTAARARVLALYTERENDHLAALEQVSKLVDDINGFYPRNQAILEESRALRADREALAHHLLRYGWHAADCPFLQDTLPCTCGLGAAETHARAILAREVGE